VKQKHDDSQERNQTIYEDLEKGFWIEITSSMSATGRPASRTKSLAFLLFADPGRQPVNRVMQP
jgi:hypothetical protein